MIELRWLCSRKTSTTPPKLQYRNSNSLYWKDVPLVVEPMSNVDFEKDALGGVLSYSTSGHNRPCGQTVGADGAGDYCLLILGTPEEAEKKAHEYVRRLERAGYKIISAIFTSNEEGYCGDRIITVDAKTDNDVNNWR